MRQYTGQQCQLFTTISTVFSVTLIIHSTEFRSIVKANRRMYSTRQHLKIDKIST